MTEFKLTEIIFLVGKKPEWHLLLCRKTTHTPTCSLKTCHIFGRWSIDEMFTPTIVELRQMVDILVTAARIIVLTHGKEASLPWFICAKFWKEYYVLLTRFWSFSQHCPNTLNRNVVVLSLLEILIYHFTSGRQRLRYNFTGALFAFIDSEWSARISNESLFQVYEIDQSCKFNIE